MTRTMVSSMLAGLALGLAGCAAGDVGTERTLVRDSAGVRIVENADRGWVAGAGWTLSDSPVLEIGVVDGAEAYQFSGVVAALRLDDGRVVVGDLRSAELRYFDTDGRHLGSVGRSGGGPGEFGFMSWVSRFRGDTLAVWDPRNRRLSFIDGGGELARSMQVELPAPAPVEGALAMVPGGLIGMFDDGTLLVAGAAFIPASGGEGLRQWSIPFYRSAPGGAVLDTIGRFPGAEAFMLPPGSMPPITRAPFGRTLEFAIARDVVYFSFPDRFDIAAFSPVGRLERRIRLSRPAAPVTREAIAAFEREERERAAVRGDDAVRRTESVLASLSYPETLPAHDELRVDLDGNLWVREYALPGSSGPSRWHVFDPDGRLVGPVELPAGFQVLDIGGDYVLGVWRDALGVEYVRMYELVK